MNEQRRRITKLEAWKRGEWLSDDDLAAIITGDPDACAADLSDDDLVRLIEQERQRLNLLADSGRGRAGAIRFINY